jgi:hypothetical protein
MHSPLFVRPGVRRAVGRGLSPLSVSTFSAAGLFLFMPHRLDSGFFLDFCGRKTKKRQRGDERFSWQMIDLFLKAKQSLFKS